MAKYHNVFILCTGRCGSDTFVQACQHIKNYSAGHETRCSLIGEERLNYPKYHIEADNRLSWMLGRLHQKYKEKSLFVHLRRDPTAVAKSYAKRAWWDGSITRAYRNGVLVLNKDEEIDICIDFVNTVESNIELFLENCESKIEVWIEDYDQDFLRFWNEVDAEGDIRAALSEFEVRRNSSEEMEARRKKYIRRHRSHLILKSARRLVGRRQK